MARKPRDAEPETADDVFERHRRSRELAVAQMRLVVFQNFPLACGSKVVIEHDGFPPVVLQLYPAAPDELLADRE